MSKALEIFRGCEQDDDDESEDHHDDELERLFVEYFSPLPLCSGTAEHLQDDFQSSFSSF